MSTMSRPTTRMNEYFVPRDGIDREVISADICRYLGNDALVRPGHYENPQTGQPVQGYYITAYRNLTTAMIEDLKADSARWDRERRAQTARNSSGGISASRYANSGAPRPRSNSPPVQYRYSETHQSRQHHGPTEPPYRDDSYPPRDGLYDAPRYPGTGAQGYNGASGPYQPQQQPPPQQQQQQQQQGYAPPSGSGGAYGGNGNVGFQQPQQSPGPADARYGGNPQGPMMNQGYQNPDGAYVSTGANMPPRNYPNDAYAGGHPGSAVPPPQQPVYASNQPVPQGYPAPNYPYPNQAPAGGMAYATQPQDPFFGRASPAGQTTQQQPQGYASQGHAYDDTPPPTRTSVPPAESQTPPRESSTRLSDRESDRNHRPPPPRR
ncbi:hypothetical protein GGI43DRAFT_176900 [Trichoderma evansii]